MRIIYSELNPHAQWRGKFGQRGKDPDQLYEAESHPLFPICEYIKPGDKIAEIGCGLGRFYKHWHSLGFDIVGIDFDGPSITQLKSENENYKVYEQDIRSLDLEERAFDIVTCFGALSNMSTVEGMADALKSLKKLTKPGGLICVSVVADNFIWKSIDYAWRFARLIKCAKEKYPLTVAMKPSEFQKLALQVGEIYPIRVEKCVTKFLFYKMPFFRKLGDRGIDMAIGESGYALNIFGRIMHRIASTLFSDAFSSCYVYVLRKA